jgi:hypothetical protein
VADLLRRRTALFPDEALMSVYHRAAFVAASFVGDVDFAQRALAIGGEPHFDGTAHAKAMTAVWIRLGHRTEAARWLARAIRETAFWSSRQAQVDPELRSLQAVFVAIDLSSFEQSGIDPNFFARSERPTFFRYAPRMAWSLGPIAWGFAILTVPAFFFAALVAESSAGFGLFEPVILLAILSRAFSRWIWTMRNSAVIEFGASGVHYRFGPIQRWVPWHAVERYGRIGKGKMFCPGLVVSREAYRQAGAKKREIPFIPIGNFKHAWPAADLNTELRRHLPHLFGADRWPAIGSD